MGWLLDNKEFDCGADSSTTSSPPPPHPGKQTFYVPSHPVFKGIGSTNQVMNNYSHQRVGVPFTVPGVQNNRGTSMQIFQLFVDGNDVTAANGISNNTIEPGGLVLSSMEFNPLNPSAPLANAPAPGTLPTINVSPNPVYDAAGYAIVEWPAGTVVRSTQVAGEMVAGYRMHFACGTHDPNVAGAGNSPSPQVGSMDLTSDGVGMFLNAVAYAISQGPEFRIITVLRAGSDVTLTWNSHTGDTYTIQQSTDIKDSLSWTDVATGIFGDFGDQTSSIVTAPAGNAPIFYRIKKQ